MNNLQKIKIMEARVASLEKDLELKGIENRLRMLKELDKNITDVVEDFEVSYKLASTWSKVSPDIESNRNIIDQSESGLRVVKQTQRNLRDMLLNNPEDKTLIRMLKDSEVLLKRFERNLEQSKKIVNRLSEKVLPVELKKTHSSLSRKIKSILVNPKDLKVRYSARKAFEYLGRKNLGEKVHVAVIYSLPYKGDHENRTSYKDVLSLKQVIGTTEVEASYINSTWLKGNVNTFFERFKEEMGGQEVIKGESDLKKIRLEVAKRVMRVVNYIANRTGETRGGEATLSDNGLLIEHSTRTQFDYRDYGQYEEPDFPEYYKDLEKELESRGLMKYVKNVYGNYSEKGWYYFEVKLK